MVHSNFNIIDDANGHENAELFLNLKRINPLDYININKTYEGQINLFTLSTHTKKGVVGRNAEVIHLSPLHLFTRII